MSDHVLKPSELKLLLRCNGIKNYKWKGFLNSGSSPRMLLENTINNQVLIGKIVSLPTEELRIWPKLQHQNLNPLLEILCLDTSKVRILISPAVGKSIGNVIQDNSFKEHPMCYERKKSYAKDVLLGINYMHQNNLCILNLNDTNVEINAYTDKAVLCDFSYVATRKKITINSLPSGIYYRPPEIENAKCGEIFSAAPVDVWYCGLLFLQIFTQHLLPWCGAVKNSLEYLDGELLSKANVGASLQQRDAIYLKRFLKNLLYPDPDFRISADEAFKLDFLQPANDRLDRKARQFWKTGAVPVHHQAQRPSHENNFASSEAGSFYSEIDILTVSENNAPASPCHTDIYQSAGMAHLIRTKSEPNTKITEEPLNPDIQGCASVPSLYRKKSNSGVSESYSRQSDVATRSYQDGLSLSVHRHKDDDSANIEDGLVNNEDSRRSPYDVFLTEWDPSYLSTDMEADDLLSDLNLGDEESKLEREKIFTGSFASSLEDMSAVSRNRLTVGPSPTWTEKRIESRDKSGSTDYCDVEPDAWYEYLEIQRHKQLLSAPSRMYENSHENTGSDFLFDAETSPSMTSGHSTSRKLSRNADRDLPRASDGSTDIFESCREIRSPSVNIGNLRTVISQTSSEELETVARMIKNLKDVSEDANTVQIADSENQFNHEESELPFIRRKWYHKLCPGCQCKRKKRKMLKVT